MRGGFAVDERFGRGGVAKEDGEYSEGRIVFVSVNQSSAGAGSLDRHSGNADGCDGAVEDIYDSGGESERAAKCVWQRAWCRR